MKLVLITVFILLQAFSVCFTEDSFHFYSKKKDRYALKTHNKHRKVHRAPKLKWSVALQKYAEGWCKILAEQELFEHSSKYDYGKKYKKKTGLSYGENLASRWAWSSRPLPDWNKKQMKKEFQKSMKQAVDSWVAEKRFYNYDNPDTDRDSFKKWGHFSQVVWKGTTEVGCAASLRMETPAPDETDPLYKRQFYVCCNYWKPGNWLRPDVLKQNVLPPKRKAKAMQGEEGSQELQSSDEEIEWKWCTDPDNCEA